MKVSSDLKSIITGAVPAADKATLSEAIQKHDWTE
jgi:hypothetical protein